MKAPITIPGKKPARKTPAGNLSHCAPGWVEFVVMLELRTDDALGVAVAEVVLVVEAEVVVADWAFVGVE